MSQIGLLSVSTIFKTDMDHHYMYTPTGPLHARAHNKLNLNS